MTDRQQQAVAQFSGKLFRILQDSHNADVIEWCSMRRGFVVHSIAELERRVLPEYFRHGKYSSFVRQLNMYGFHKLRASSDETVFCHAAFTQLDRFFWDLFSEQLWRIQRKGARHAHFADENTVPSTTPKNTQHLIEELVERVRRQSTEPREQRRLVYSMRKQCQYSQLSGSKHLEDIYQRLGIERASDALSELSIEEEIECGASNVVPLKSLALLQSQHILRKNSDLLSGSSDF